jgi:hypothetical protein
MRDDLAIRRIENDVFILVRDDSTLHSFNETGTFIWDQLQSGTPVGKIPQMIADRFEINIDAARNDMIEFINDLEKTGLISISA